MQGIWWRRPFWRWSSKNSQKCKKMFEKSATQQLLVLDVGSCLKRALAKFHAYRSVVRGVNGSSNLENKNRSNFRFRYRCCCWAGAGAAAAPAVGAAAAAASAVVSFHDCFYSGNTDGSDGSSSSCNSSSSSNSSSNSTCVWKTKIVWTLNIYFYVFVDLILYVGVRALSLESSSSTADPPSNALNLSIISSSGAFSWATACDSYACTHVRICVRSCC